MKFMHKGWIASAAAAAALLFATSAGAEQPVKAVHQTGPVYPVTAKRQGIEGYVRMAFTVDAKGKVRDARVVDSQPEKIFDQAALNAVRQWRFESGSSAAPAEQVVRLDFTL